jgi:hypothetical protein
MSNVAGRWQVTLDTPMGQRSGVLELKVDGGRLSGSLSDGEHRALIEEGEVSGQRLKWTSRIEKPMRLAFKFTAEVEGDSISGAAKHFLGSASFTGKRI